VTHALDVGGDLRIETRAGTLDVHARGTSLGLSLPSLRAGLALLGPRPAREARLHELDAMLRLTDLRMVVRLGTREIARLGPGTRPGVLSRLLGLGPLEVRAPRLLRAVAARRSEP
jgi:hypothetical protein